jgi:predicted MPP superfamily phosphohydrolase
MPESLRLPLFIAIVLVVWTAMNLYVFRRIGALVAPYVGPWSRRSAAILLWTSFPLARILDRTAPAGLARVFDWFGSTWLGVLFLLTVFLLAADILCGFGRLWPGGARPLRLAAALTALVLSAFALFQALRPPVVSEHEAAIPGLPAERDGTRLLLISDLHLGTILGERWLSELVDRIDALHPDAVFVVGDLVDGNARRVEPLVPLLSRIRAPLGVFAVTGNHEYYAGLDRSVRLLRDSGFTVLRDESRELAPGLVVAGVDDLTARRQYGQTDGAVEKALTGVPPARSAILLSHSPLMAREAAAAGADLMLSDHTHDGQIWPFGNISRLFYPLVAGVYRVDGMTVIVCRGTGTWGPRMRLFRPSEMLLVTLRR